MLQGVTTVLTLMVIYMVFVLMDYQGGIDSFIGTTLIQPIIGGVLSILTIGICLLIGLPIRISSSLNTWWTERIWLALAGVLCGFSMIIVTVLPSMATIVNTTIEGEVVQRQIPNLGFAGAGWLLTAFSVLHLFPPYQSRIWMEGLIAKYIVRSS
jgi:hypothetical protein